MDQWKASLTEISNKQQEVNDAISKFVDPNDQYGRIDIVTSVLNLLQAVTSPAEALIQQSGMTHLSGAIRTAIYLNLFETVPEQGSITASEIAKATNADKLLIVRHMRALAAYGIFKEFEAETYEHNAYSRAYLNDVLRDWVKTM